MPFAVIKERLQTAAPSATVEYYRHGTLSLYAALAGFPCTRAVSVSDFLGEVVALCRPKQEIHNILDNPEHGCNQSQHCR
jgi:hypothetical protein